MAGGEDMSGDVESQLLYDALVTFPDKRIDAQCQDSMGR
jgi:hypothetical protein